MTKEELTEIIIADKKIRAKKETAAGGVLHLCPVFYRGWAYYFPFSKIERAPLVEAHNVKKEIL